MGTRETTCPSHMLDVSDILVDPDDHGSEDPASSSQVEAEINE